MDNYYDQLLISIKQAIIMQDFLSAQDLIANELKMPYVPLYIEKQLNELKDQLPKSDDHKQRLVGDHETIAMLLNGNNEQQAQAIEYLSELNIRSYLSLIRHYLINSDNEMLKSILVAICIKQQVNEELTIFKEGCQIDFVPATIENPMDTEGYIVTQHLLTVWLINDDPTLLTLTLDILMQLVYLKLPESYVEEETENLAYSILRYVLVAMNDDQRWLNFKEEMIIKEEYLIDINL